MRRGALWVEAPGGPVSVCCPHVNVTRTLQQQVLVLNRLWQPVNVCSAKRALGLLFLGHAQVVQTSGEAQFSTHDLESWLREAPEGEGEAVIRTVSACYLVPYIIVLAAFDRLPRKEVKFTRDNVFARDGHRCQYCGEHFETRDLNLDHVIPRDKGGSTSWDNVVCSCIRCNTKKANKLPQEAGMVPLRKPAAPRWRPLVGARNDGRRNAKGEDYPESWRVFLEPCSSKEQLG